MNFDLSEEQTLLRDAIDKLVLKEYSFEQRRKHSRGRGGWSREVWAQLAEQGFLGLPFDEASGGLGYGPVESMLVMEAVGRGLMLEPYLDCVLLAGGVLRAAATSQQLEAWVPPIVSGEQLVVLACGEKQSRYRLDDVATTATAQGEGYRLKGSKIALRHGEAADRFLVSARTSGSRTARDGISLFLVDAGSDGLRQRSYRTQDGLRAIDLMFDEVLVPESHVVGTIGEAASALERGAQSAIAALAAEAVGCMQAMLDLTVDYLKQRKQFGGPISRFQALQHQAAEMLVEVEQARSMAMLAALVLDDDDAAERERTLSAVKALIGRSGRFVAERAVQLHGGIGVTEEAAVGHYFKRLTMIDLQFGDSDFHLSKLAAGGGLIGRAERA